jgi:hypothetical protein
MVLHVVISKAPLKALLKNPIIATAISHGPSGISLVAASLSVEAITA